MLTSLTRITFSLSIFLFISFYAQAQNKTTFTGKIVDESELPVPGATVMLLHAADSVLAMFNSTDANGAFTLKNVPKGDFLVYVTFLGMQPIYHPVTSGNDEQADLGTLRMDVESNILSEVEVAADHIPIQINKDTITYNADAFQTQPNAVVEDLLKKLPGIEVGADGSIKAQGEEVQRVTVDGKEFFGTDPKMATKNLPAKAIKRVKVFDKKSDQAEFTGVDDGEREKTIDLQLKEEFKKGVFGKTEAGYGSDDRYLARATINKFTKGSQMSFLGQLNNINEQSFSFNDMMNFSGGMQRFMGGGRSSEIRISSDIPFGEDGDGLTTTGAAGLNFNWHKSPRFNIRTSYFFNNVRRDLIQDIFRQNLSDNPFDTDEHQSSETENGNHRFSLDSDIKPDSSQQFEISARASFGDASGQSTSLLRQLLPGNQLQSESFTNEDNDNNNLSLNADVLYMKRLKKPGRSFSIGGTLTESEQETNSKLEALTEYFTTGSTELLDQLQFTESNSTSWQGQFSFTEPLQKRKFLEFSYNYNQTQSDYDKNVSDIENNIPVNNPLLSNTYSSVFEYHRPGAAFRYNGKIHTINIATSYQMSALRGTLLEELQEINKEYNHFLPRAMWRYDIGNGKNLRINYSTRINAPSITQLSPVIDNSDPLRLYTGNPDLNAEYTHSINLGYHSFSQFNSSGFFASMSGSLTKDKIITSRSVDELFRETLSPINIADETTLSMYGSYSRPFKFIHSRVSFNVNFNYTNTQNQIDNLLLDVNRWTRTGGISISNMNSEVLEYALGGSWTLQSNLYSTEEALNQNSLLHNYFVDVTLTVWKKWQLSASYDYQLYTSSQFGDSQALPLFEASLSRYILPNDRGQLILSFFDILDENRGLSRTNDINYIQEVRANSIGRFAMLKFVYTLNAPGKEPAGAIRIIERRR